MKKVTACLTALCLGVTCFASLATLTACGSSDLTILLLANNAEDDFYKAYFADLEKEYDIKIDYSGLEESGYYERLNSVILQGDTPDIFYVRPNEIMRYREQIQSLENYSKTQTAVNLSDVYPSALNMYRYNPTTKKLDENGDLYAFPKDLSSQQLGYNRGVVEKYKTDIEAAGLKLPWDMDFTTENYSWAEFRTMCEIISSKKVEGTTYYGCDVPDIEILAMSYNRASLLNGDTVNITSDDMKAALQLQADLCTPSAADKKAAASYAFAKYENFTGGTVAFYGACGSWEIGQYNDYFKPSQGHDMWGVMPWPTVNGNVDWYGKIMTAGFVVSKDCKKADIAMEIAASFMTTKIQDKLVREEQITLPITKTFANAYVDQDNNDLYSPTTRGVYIDVISGKHGFFPTQYKTYDNIWRSKLNAELEKMWKADNPATYYASMDLNAIQSLMQTEYDKIKNK